MELIVVADNHSVFLVKVSEPEREHLANYNTRQSLVLGMFISSEAIEGAACEKWDALSIPGVHVMFVIKGVFPLISCLFSSVALNLDICCSFQKQAVQGPGDTGSSHHLWSSLAGVHSAVDR